MRPYEALEVELEEWTGMPTAVCSSGTAALHLALEALKLQGRYVIVPNFCFYAVPRAVKLAGFEPLFVGCRPDGLMDCDQLDEALNGWRDEVAAIVAVHTYGRLCDMHEIYTLAYGIPVVEDMAEAHGCPVDIATQAAAWSFQGSKIVHGEEGGAVSFKYEDTLSVVRSLRTFGNHGDYNHAPNGNNYRLADALAEQIRSSLRCVKQEVVNRRAFERHYDEACPTAWKAPTRRDSPWMYDFRLHGLDAAEQKRIVDAVSGLKHGFKLMTSQPEFKDSLAVESQLLNPYSVLCTTLGAFDPTLFSRVAEASTRSSPRPGTSGS